MNCDIITEYNHKNVTSFLSWITKRHGADGGVTEVRILGDGPFKGVWNSYLKPNEISRFVEQITPIKQRDKLPFGDFPRIGEAHYYFSLNPINPDLYARSGGKIVRAKFTSSDKDILGYSLLGIDIDPIRPSGISSTDVEHAIAYHVANQIKEWLHGYSIHCLHGDSGNGSHILIPVTLQKEKEVFSQKYQQLLQHLQEKFGDYCVEIDPCVFNPSRIFKLYGSLAMKGYSTEDRPHRWAEIEINDIKNVNLHQMWDVLLPRKVNKKPQTDPDHKKYKKLNALPKDWDQITRDDKISIIRELLTQQGYPIKEKFNDIHHLFRFETCPHHTDHDGDSYECCVTVNKKGVLGANCMHDPQANWKRNFKHVLKWDEYIDDIWLKLDLPLRENNSRNNFNVPPEVEEELEKAIIEFNKRHAIVKNGGKCLALKFFLNNEHREIEFINRENLRNFYANRQIWAPGRGDKWRKQPISEAWFEHPKRKTYEGIVFDPSGKTEKNTFNLWQGWPIQPIEGDCSIFKEHIKEVLCGNAPDEGAKNMWFTWIWMWMADAIQNPNDRPGTAIVIRGKQGTGKSKFSEIFGKLFGPHYLEVSQASQFLGKHNAQLQNCLLLNANEAFWAGTKQDHGAIKHLITNKELFIEPKGMDGYKVDNHLRMIITSNEDWVIPADADSRRFFVIECSDHKRNDTKFFGSMVEQMENGGYEALMYELLTTQITKDILRKAPETVELLQQKQWSFTKEQWWWFDLLRHGSLQDCEGSWEQLVSKETIYYSYANFMDRVARNERRSVETQLGKFLRRWCPGIRSTRKRPPSTDRGYWDQAERDENSEYQNHVVPCWIFPKLREVRNKFEEFIGHEVDWEEEDQKDSNQSNSDQSILPF